MGSKQPQNSKLQFIDLENLCWPSVNPPEGQTNHIIQIGIVEINTNNLTITRKERYYVRPKDKNFDVSEYCINLTGITKEIILAEGHYLPEVLRTIKKEFSPGNKVTYAWGDDQEDIRQHCKLYEVENPCDEFGIWNFGTVFHQSFCLSKKLTLEKALNHLGLEFQGKPHDALTDAENLAYLHIETLKQLRKNH